MATFKGFSTVNKRKPPFLITDSDLIKQDLMNEFYTKKGERVMLPEFGSIIWDMLMEPLDDDTKRIIETDVYRIIGNEPRVKLVGLDMQEVGQQILIRVLLYYVTEDITEPMFLSYKRTPGI